MSAQDVQTIREGYEAFARQDIPAVLAAFDPNITWETPDAMPFGGTRHGHDEVIEFFQDLSQHWRDLSVAPLEFIDGGDTVVVRCRISGVGAAGPLETESLHLWRMRDGKGVEFTEYTDTARALEALGTPAAAARA
ncbi:MAG: uncharacterized protein QOI62_761 [Solirubrobacteraceae bacterium]|nr:uncharacterized protein [Solirubrobacteraceae bacterium]MEA2357501.1 uncharacterized protein [Solirubrobacteraceae bacterium]MEA2392809.1 uncharacterized protein [Solirubrobacteraceae bacterium]